MILKKEYQILNEEKVLVGEVLYDGEDNILIQKSYEEGGTIEIIRSYNDDNLLKEEKHIENNIELNRTEYVYDSKSRVLLQKLIIKGETYEEIVSTYLEDRNEITTVREGQEVDKVINYEDSVIKMEFYNHGVLEQVMERTDYGKKSKSIYWDDESNLKSTIEEEYTKEGDLIFEKEYNSEGELIYEYLIERKKGQVISELFRHLGIYGSFLKNLYYYDNRGNHIKTESLDGQGQVILQFNIEYDSQKRIIREYGYDATNELNVVESDFIYEYEIVSNS